MAYELVTINSLAPQGVRRYQPALNAPAYVDNSQMPTASTSNAGISVDGTLAASWAGASFRIHRDLNDFSNDVVTPSIQPSGTWAGSQIALSANLVAVSGGGTSPILVYDRAGSNIPVPVPGLGSNVTGLLFLAGGASLLVLHNTTPYVRVYNTSTWAYVDAPATGNAKLNAVEARNGKVVLSSATSPYHYLFDPAASTITGVSALSGYTVGSSGIPSFCADPANGDCVFLGNNSVSGNGIRLARYNTVTGVITALPAITALLGTVPSAVRACVADEFFGRVHVLAGAANPVGDWPPLFSFDAATLVPDARENWGHGGLTGVSALAAALRNRPHCGVVSGTVRDVSNNPVARTVRAYHSGNGRLLGVTQSSAVDGSYVMKLGTQDPVDMVFKTAAGENLNNLIQARVVPQPA